MVYIDFEAIFKRSTIWTESCPVPFITFVVLVSEPVVKEIDLACMDRCELGIVLSYNFDTFPAVRLLIGFHIHRVIMIRCAVLVILDPCIAIRCVMLPVCIGKIELFVLVYCVDPLEVLHHVS